MEYFVTIEDALSKIEYLHSLTESKSKDGWGQKIFSFFVQNEFDFNKKTKAANLFHTFNKKKNSCIPSLLV